MAAALRRLRIGDGDVVALYMPMTPEIVIALFAIGRIGAIVLPLFSGYGPDALASRLNSAGAKVLFTADGFYRRGQVVAMKEVADQAATQAPSLERVIVLRRTGATAPWTEGRDLWWHDVMQHERMSHELTGESAFADREGAIGVMDAEDPLMIIYTSGTTGQPKGALHTHCGFPVKAAQDLAHCFDLKSSDTIYWVTDMGWMMGPWSGGARRHDAPV
jgi:acetyl-CoA synthetase